MIIYSIVWVKEDPYHWELEHETEPEGASCSEHTKKKQLLPFFTILFLSVVILKAVVRQRV
jgi:hypothetical protein